MGKLFFFGAVQVDVIKDAVGGLAGFVVGSQPVGEIASKPLKDGRQIDGAMSFFHAHIARLLHELFGLSVELVIQSFWIERFGWEVGTSSGRTVERKVNSRFLKVGSNLLVFQVVQVVPLAPIYKVNQAKEQDLSRVRGEVAPGGDMEDSAQHRGVVGVDPISEPGLLIGEGLGVSFWANVSHGCKQLVQRITVFCEGFVVHSSLGINMLLQECMKRRSERADSALGLVLREVKGRQSHRPISQAL